MTPAVTAGAFLLVTWIATKGLFFFLQQAPAPTTKNSSKLEKPAKLNVTKTTPTH